MICIRRYVRKQVNAEDILFYLERHIFYKVCGIIKISRDRFLFFDVQSRSIILSRLSVTSGALL